MKVIQMSDNNNDGDQIMFFLWSNEWIYIQWVDEKEGASSAQQAQCKISAQKKTSVIPRQNV